MRGVSHAYASRAQESLVVRCSEFPIEVKKSASPAKSDARNFSALLPAAADGVPSGLAALKREVGMGAVICMSDDAFPLADNVWAFPSWAI